MGKNDAVDAFNSGRYHRLCYGGINLLIFDVWFDNIVKGEEFGRYEFLGYELGYVGEGYIPGGLRL